MTKGASASRGRTSRDGAAVAAEDPRCQIDRPFRAAHQRAALDLFEKRFEVYDAMRGVIGGVVRSGHAPFDVALAFLRASDRAKFLFGPEVNAYLASVYRGLLDLDVCDQMLQTAGPSDRAKWVSKRTATFFEIAKYYEAIDGLVTPYMRMHQRAARI